MKTAAIAFLLFPLASLIACGGGGSGQGSLPGIYTISGFVNNLNKSPLKLQDNGGDTLTVQNFGAFTFLTPLNNGASYRVTVLSQPPNGQTCAVQNGTGTVNASHVTSILVNCFEPMKVGGLVFGLLGKGLALQNNGSDTLQILSNGAFQFSSTINYGQSFDVTVSTHPSRPAQRCTVTNATGSPQMDVGNVLISCGSAEARWAWMGGSQSKSLYGIYGQRGVPAPGNNPGARASGMSWTDKSGNFWLFGGTYGDYFDNLNDLWRYSNGEWAWISGSSAGDNPQGTYGTEGTPGPLNTPGARVEGSTWTDSAGNLWLFGGYGQYNSVYHYFNDLWRFSNNQWTWVSGSDQPDQPPVYGTLGMASAANVPGARLGAMAWIDADDNLWLFGGVDVITESSNTQNDLWRFSKGQWTWMGGSNDPTSQQPGVYGTLGTPSAANIPGARYGGAAWIDSSGAFWLFGGRGIDSAGSYGSLNDLWRLKDGQWAWMSGSNLAGDLGTFGTMGIPSPANVPSARLLPLAWTDVAGNFWLFGGGGKDRAQNEKGLNDLWKYTGGQWTYMSGSELALQAPNYGPLGIPSADSLPGGCSGDMQWRDKAGRLWAYCYNDNVQDGLVTFANDLWMYQP
jgi:hypothetical protein